MEITSLPDLLRQLTFEKKTDTVETYRSVSSAIDKASKLQKDGKKFHNEGFFQLPSSHSWAADRYAEMRGYPESGIGTAQVIFETGKGWHTLRNLKNLAGCKGAPQLTYIKDTIGDQEESFLMITEVHDSIDFQEHAVPSQEIQSVLMDSHGKILVQRDYEQNWREIKPEEQKALNQVFIDIFFNLDAVQ